MKKIITAIGLFVATFIVLVSAQSGNENISKGYKDISDYGLNGFVNMDLGLIAYFPKKQDWTRIAEKIKSVPLDSLRYIDSLDIHYLADTMYVKVYSQNYANQSSNTYKIAKNTNKSTDTLMIFNFKVDFKMKDIIADARSFRVKNFTADYITKQNVSNIDKRIIINKKYL
jgi:hypothetical protein